MARRTVPAMVALLAGTMAAAMAVRQRLQLPAPTPTVKPWLTVAEASRYSGLSEGLLVGLIRAGKLPSLDRPPKVRRTDLERIAAGLVGAREGLRQAMKARRG